MKFNILEGFTSYLPKLNEKKEWNEILSHIVNIFPNLTRFSVQLITVETIISYSASLVDKYLKNGKSIKDVISANSKRESSSGGKMGQVEKP